jgi:8-oxo-dGTP pyrophosphatase MutT (NUDIX family)
LLAEGYDPSCDFRYHISIGGGVEFGETLHDAAQRELHEEIGISDHPLDFIGFHEAIFTLNGIPEHQIIYHFSCHISDKTRAILPDSGTESNGGLFTIQWFSREDLESIQSNIVPPGIYSELQQKLEQSSGRR